MSNLREKYQASLQMVEGKYTQSLSEWPHEKQGETSSLQPGVPVIGQKYKSLK